MPATSERQRKFFGSVVGGAAPMPSGMTMKAARDFARKPEHFAEGGVVGRTQKDYLALANRIAKEKFGNTELADIFLRMMAQESGNFHPDVVEGRRKSSAGATGIAQLMPVHFSQVNPLDPEAALRYGADYLSTNIKTFNGDVAKGVAAYNGGPGTVNNAVARGGANWRGSLPGETQEYLRITLPGGTGGAVPMPSPSGAPATGSAPPMPGAGGASARPSYTWQRPVAGAIAQDNLYGAAWEGYAQGFHTGLDFLAVAGAPIVSATGGRITYLGPRNRAGQRVLINGPQGGTGNTVEVTDDEGNVHTYAHLGGFGEGLKEGQAIQVGTPLGVVGNTGNSQGAHLHYELKPKAGGERGVPQADPIKFLAVRGIDIDKPGAQSGASTTTTTPAGATAPRGGAAVPPTTTTSPEQQYAARATKAYDDAVAEFNDLSRKPPTPETNQRLAVLAELLPVLQTNADDAQKNAIAVARLNPQGLTPDQAAASELGWAQLTENRRNNDVQIVTALLGNATEEQKLALAVIQQNDLNAEREVSSRLRKGEITSADARAILEGRHVQQADQLLWAAEGLKRAGFIDEVDFRNATRMLPAGTRFQPGFEPSSALNQALGMWNLAPLTVATVEVPRDSLDPMANLARGRESLEAAGIAKPDYGTDITRLENQYAANQALPTFTAPVGGAQTAAPAAPSDWQTQLSRLLSGNQPAVGPSAPPAMGAEPAPLPTPETSTNPTQAPMSPGQDSDAFNIDAGNASGQAVPVVGPMGAQRAQNMALNPFGSPDPTPLQAGVNRAQNPFGTPGGQGGPPQPLPTPPPDRNAPVPHRGGVSTLPVGVNSATNAAEPGAPVPGVGYYDPKTGFYYYANGMRAKIG